MTSKTTTRAMLSEAVARKTKLDKHDVLGVSAAMFTMMAEALSAGENIKLSRFGSLQLRERAERVGRNPRTGMEHRISPRRAVVFIPATKLREALNQ